MYKLEIYESKKLENILHFTIELTKDEIISVCDLVIKIEDEGCKRTQPKSYIIDTIVSTPGYTHDDVFEDYFLRQDYLTIKEKITDLLINLKKKK